MPVSGRRYAALQRQAAEQRADILRLERDLTTVTGERDAAREIIRGLSDRNRELVRPAPSPGMRPPWSGCSASPRRPASSSSTRSRPSRPPTRP
jgi:hypothetical protein